MRAAKLADMRGESYEQGVQDIEWYDGIAAEVFSNGAVQIEYTNAHAGTADDIIRPLKPSGESHSRQEQGVADVYVVDDTSMTVYEGGAGTSAGRRGGSAGRGGARARPPQATRRARPWRDTAHDQPTMLV